MDIKPELSLVSRYMAVMFDSIEKNLTRELDGNDTGIGGTNAENEENNEGLWSEEDKTLDE